MARRTVIWHIGPDDPGTEFLAEALDRSREELAALGIAVPQRTPEDRWHEIEDRIWKHKGVSVLSTPTAARAGKEAVELRRCGLRDVELHLVVLVRDLPVQVHAAWLDAVRHGSTTPLTTYAARVLDPERRHWQAEEFWAGRELTDVLPRWTRAIHADRVHVVAVAADARAVWNALLGQAGVGELPLPDGLPVPPVLAAALDPERVLDVTTSWAKLVADRGFDQHGSLIGRPLTAAPAAGPVEQLAAVAELLGTATAEAARLRDEVSRLRRENARLDRKRRKHKRRLAAALAVDSGHQA